MCPSCLSHLQFLGFDVDLDELIVHAQFVVVLQRPVKHGLQRLRTAVEILQVEVCYPDILLLLLLSGTQSPDSGYNHMTSSAEGFRFKHQIL